MFEISEGRGDYAKCIDIMPQGGRCYKVGYDKAVMGLYDDIVNILSDVYEENNGWTIDLDPNFSCNLPKSSNQYSGFGEIDFGATHKDVYKKNWAEDNLSPYLCSVVINESNKTPGKIFVYVDPPNQENADEIMSAIKELESKEYLEGYNPIV